MDQPISPTPPVFTPTPVEPETVKKSYIWVIVVIFTFLLATSGFLFYQNQKLQKQIASLTPAPLTSPQPAAEAADPTTDWKTYNGKTLSFKYPVNWSVKEEYSEYFSGEIVSIDNPTKTVSIEVTPRGQPYGFGPRDGFKESQIKLTIDGKEYLEKETVIDNRTAFVDFSIQTNGKEYFILFGTGYPVNDDQKASIVDYNQEKNVIIQILSTFKFLN